MFPRTTQIAFVGCVSASVALLPGHQLQTLLGSACIALRRSSFICASSLSILASSSSMTVSLEVTVASVWPSAAAEAAARADSACVFSSSFACSRCSEGLPSRLAALIRLPRASCSCVKHKTRVSKSVATYFVYNSNLKQVLSQLAPGACGASQLPPDRLVQSVTGITGICTTCELPDTKPIS